MLSLQLEWSFLEVMVALNSLHRAASMNELNLDFPILSVALVHGAQIVQAWLNSSDDKFFIEKIKGCLE